MNHKSVAISPIPSHVGEHVSITYNGMLSGAGAEEVWIHAGYGQGEWESVHDYPMFKMGDQWSQTVKIDNSGQFNFCFKDGASNWDNNYGLNWIFRIAK